MKTAAHNPKLMAGAAIGAGLLIAVAGWMFLVSPKRAKAEELKAEAASVQSEINVRRAALAKKPKITIDVRHADLYRLTKAVPDRTDMAGIVLQLSRLAKRNGVGFHSITPAVEIPAAGYKVQPLNVVVEGRFAEVNGFLNTLRRLVTVRKGRLDAGGRLFAVDNVTISEPQEAKFPTVQASVTMNAFVYAGGALTTPAGGGTTTPDTTTPSVPNGAVAAGATP